MNSITTTGPGKTVKSRVRNAFAAAALLATTGLGACCPQYVQTRQPTPVQAQKECPGQDTQRAEQAGKFLAENKHIFAALYNRALKRDPTLEGRVEVTLKIGKDGAVTCITIGGKGANEEVREKYSRILGQLKVAPGACETVAQLTIVNVRRD